MTASGLFQDIDLYNRRRWREVHYFANLFWKQWVKEYLPLLQEWQKWKIWFSVGDLVIIMDPTAPRGSWLMGKLLETYPDNQRLVCETENQNRRTGQTCYQELATPRGFRGTYDELWPTEEVKEDSLAFHFIGSFLFAIRGRCVWVYLMVLFGQLHSRPLGADKWWR